MKRLRFAVVALCLCVGATSVQAATVTGNMLDIFGNAAGTSVRFVPSGPLAIGTNTYLDYPRSARITNGLFSVWLAGGFYDADFVPYTLKPIRVLVWPSDTNTYTFNQAATLAVNAAMFNGSNLTVSVTLLTNELAFVPQVGSDNLTNWAALTAADYSNTLAGAWAAADLSVSNSLYESIQAVAGSNGVVSFNTRTGLVTLTSNDVVTALGFTPGTGSGTGDGITNNQSGVMLADRLSVTGATPGLVFQHPGYDPDGLDGIWFGESIHGIGLQLGKLGESLPNVTVADGDVFAGGFYALGDHGINGNGENITNLNASALASGTVPLERLSGISSNQFDVDTWLLATNTTPGWRLTEPGHVGGSNTFEPVYAKTQGTNLFILAITNHAADGLYEWQSAEVDNGITTTLYQNTRGDKIYNVDDGLDYIYTFISDTGLTNFDGGEIRPEWGSLVVSNIGGGAIGPAALFWNTNYTFGGFGVNGQTPTDGAVLAFGAGLNYSTNGSIWTIFSTNIPAPSLGTTNPPAADKVLTLDSNTNLYWATPAAGGGEVTIGTNTIPTDKHFVLLGETSTNEPNLIVSWQSYAPVMASGGFAGKGLLLTDLNASELSSGTVPLARLGTNTASAGQVLTAVDGATEWADASGGVTLEQVAAGGFLNVSNSEVILNSDTYMAWSTNGAIRLTAKTNNLGIVLSNGFASASFQNYGPGLFDVAWTLDGTNWSKAMTNAEVTVGVINIITEPDSSGPTGITNLGLYSWIEPERFGKTNFTRGQILIVDRPKLADAAAPLRTVTNEAWRAVRNQTNWASIPAKSEVDLGGYGERLTAEWKRTATATTNADSLDWLWTGTNVWSVVGPPSVSVSRAEYSVVVSSLTNVLVTLPAAYTSSVPRVLFSHTAKSPAWSRLSSTATATNDTLEVAFTVPNADYGFFRIAIDDGTPSFGTLNGVLELTPRTIAATNSTTWGRGSGLVCVDGDYVYISVGTNAWKRATLEAW